MILRLVGKPRGLLVRLLVDVGVGVDLFEQAVHVVVRSGDGENRVICCVKTEVDGCAAFNTGYTLDVVIAEVFPRDELDFADAGSIVHAFVVEPQVGIERQACEQSEGQAEGRESDSFVLAAEEGIDASDDGEGTSKHEDHFCNSREGAEMDVVHALIAAGVYIQREDPAENE